MRRRPTPLGPTRPRMTPETFRNMTSRMHSPRRTALRRSPDFRRFLVSCSLQVSRLCKPPLPDNARAPLPLPSSEESRTDPPSRVSALHGNAYAAILPPRRPSPYIFMERPPQIMLISAARGFNMYIFSRIQNRFVHYKKRNNVNERIGLIKGMIWVRHEA